LLRSVNRLNDLIDSVRIDGDILLHGDSIYAPGVDVIELRKRIGMVFQKANPFPMSIYENVVYALRIDGERDRRVLDAACERSLSAKISAIRTSMPAQASACSSRYGPVASLKICTVSDGSGCDGSSVIKREPSAVNKSGAVSLATRAIDNMMPVSTPPDALG